MAEISALGWRQKDQELKGLKGRLCTHSDFEANLGYLRPCFKNKQPAGLLSTCPNLFAICLSDRGRGG